MTIFLIALLPAFGVFLVAAVTECKFKTTVAALIAAAVGIFTGDPAYMALDLLFVIIAYWVSVSMLGGGSSKKPSPVAPRPDPTVVKSGSDVGTTLGVLGGLGFLAYVIFGSGSNHSSATQSPPAAVAQPAAATPASSYVLALSKPAHRPAVVPTQPKRPPKTPLQRCLEIRSDENMVKCLERLRE